jgi:hypothetical protein
MKKRGQANIVVVVLLILIVIAAVVVVANVILSVVKHGSEKTGISVFTTQIDLKAVEMPVSGGVNVSVHRSSGGENVTKLLFIFEDINGNIQNVEVKENIPQELETRNFNFTTTKIGSIQIKKITIIPVIGNQYGIEVTSGEKSSNSGSTPSPIVGIDSDGDGYNSTSTGGGDCNDSNSSINPGATEVCNGINDDCDLAIDEECECTPLGSTQTCGSDVGECVSGLQACTVSGWGACIGGTGPVAEVPYNDLDEDCSGSDLIDVDGDGYDSDQVTGGDDCNDNDDEINPGESEICDDGIDNNCVNGEDEGCGGGPEISEKSCAELGWTNAASRGDPLVCGESDTGLGGCSGFKTWANAKTFCETPGARLCTEEEIDERESGGTGCGYDSYMIWTSTSCATGYLLGKGNGDGTTECKAVSDTAYTRCCADVF